jgi:hypothetical protein
VAALHALWDAAQPIAVWLTLRLTATQVQSQLLQVGQVPAVTQAQVHLFTALYWSLLILDALIGLLVLRGRWRRATTPRSPGRDRAGSAAEPGHRRARQRRGAAAMRNTVT